VAGTRELAERRAREGHAPPRVAVALGHRHRVAGPAHGPAVGDVAQAGEARAVAAADRVAAAVGPEVGGRERLDLARGPRRLEVERDPGAPDVLGVGVGVGHRRAGPGGHVGGVPRRAVALDAEVEQHEQALAASADVAVELPGAEARAEVARPGRGRPDREPVAVDRPHRPGLEPHAARDRDELRGALAAVDGPAAEVHPRLAAGAGARRGRAGAGGGQDGARPEDGGAELSPGPHRP
jgi:hypothetical protein